MGDKIKVGILTTFNSADPAYSLNGVVQNQIKMLNMGGYQPVVIVAQGFQPVEEYLNAEIRTIPSVPCSNEMSSVEDKTFTEDIEKLYNTYKENLADINVTLTHDLVYQPAQVKHQIAARKLAAERSDLRWLHWIHSATSPQTLIQQKNFYESDYKSMLVKQFPNSFYIFFNDWSKRRVAANFGVPVDKVRTVYHPTDIFAYLGIQPLSREIIEKNNLLDADMVCVYPARLDNGKNVHIALELMMRVGSKGFNTKMVVGDFHSTSADPRDPKFQVRMAMRATADQGGYAKDLIFLSEHSPETKSSVPNSVIRDLFLISNVFIMPSVSESYSLVTQEAILAKNMIILNIDFPPFREIFGEDNIFIGVGSNVNKDTGLDGDTTRNYNNRDEYMNAVAMQIVEEFQKNKVLKTHAKIRKERNLKYVWEHQLQPLIQECLNIVS